jgi:hypothetical protein
VKRGRSARVRLGVGSCGGGGGGEDGGGEDGGMVVWVEGRRGGDGVALMVGEGGVLVVVWPVGREVAAGMVGCCSGSAGPMVGVG